MKAEFSLTILATVSCAFLAESVLGQKNNDQDGTKYYSLLMPNIQPTKQDIALCTAFQVPSNDYSYIVEFMPNNTSIHSKNRMVISGCELPGKMEEGNPRVVWDCGGPNGPHSDYPAAPVCASGTEILYSWSEDTPGFRLPEGIGFKVGKGTGINYLVLKVYYADIGDLTNGSTDSSGLTMTVLPSTTNRILKKAGLYHLSTGGVIQSGTHEKFECACTIEKPVEMHPFAFRPHAHALGQVVSAYKVDKTGYWYLIGKGDPQKPMKFYPVKDDGPVIYQGDIVAARCTMYNFKDKDIFVGPTVHDEMCMVYMMYWVDDDKPLAKSFCHSDGPPLYYWSKDPKIAPVPPYINKVASEL